MCTKRSTCCARTVANSGETAAQSGDWRGILTGGVNSASQVAELFKLDSAAFAKAPEMMPVRINAYYLSLIQEADDPLGRQVIPSLLETAGSSGSADPLEEEADSPVPHLVHRYPDRVLLLVTYQCAVYCRFCTRRRSVGSTATPTDAEISKAIDYIRDNEKVRDVIISGGDPLLLPDEKLFSILSRLRAIPHVEIIRLDTRTPCVLPARITRDLSREMAKYHPLYVNTHFNHPREVTAEAARACAALADSGIPVGNQTVLLKGINDDPEVMRELNQKLLSIRVKPYYLYQCDQVSGTEHFQTSVRKGIQIVSSLRGHTSGMAVPTFVIDTPGGGGKVPLLPDDVIEFSEKRVVVKNYEGKVFTYDEPNNGK